MMITLHSVSVFLAAFEHIEVTGHGLEVTVLQSTRLNTKLANSDQTEVYCTASRGTYYLF